MSTNPPHPSEFPQDPVVAPGAASGTPPVYQPPAAQTPAYGAAPGYADSGRGNDKGPSTLGLVALLAAIAAVVLGSILVGLGGAQLGALAQYIDPATGQTRPDADTSQANAIAAGGGILIVVGWLAYAALGLWGLIQGIVAAVKNRGRALGITAIVVAVVGAVIVFIVMTVAIGIGAAPYATTM